jgi:outer membrane immunogenic protein
MHRFAVIGAGLLSIAGFTGAASAADLPARTYRSEGCHNATGGLAGGQIGYRWQTTNWMFGVEAQGDWADLTGSNASHRGP